MDNVDSNHLHDNDEEELEQEEENDTEHNVQDDDNDSNSDKRFPEPNTEGWIHWFCELKVHRFFTEIDKNYLKKKSNWIGIKYQEYLNTITNPKSPANNNTSKKDLENLQQIRDVYGWIHKRFIRTPTGWALMREKYWNQTYGHCPKIHCEKQILLPLGLSEDLKYSRVKVYCPTCEQVYKPKEEYSLNIDGAYFGTSFPMIFLMTYPDLNPRNKTIKSYIPKLYGFKVFGKKGSKYYNKDKTKLEELMRKLNINE